MAQRLDDVTGLPPAPLSATQREERMKATVSTLNAVILQMNAHVAGIRELRDRVALLEAAAHAPRGWRRLLANLHDLRVWLLR